MNDFINTDIQQTGLTREDILNYCGQIILGIIQYMDKESKLPILPFRDQKENYRYTVCPEEAFERSMIAAAFYANATDSEEINGLNYVDYWREGVLRLSDPKSPYFWDKLGEHSPLGSQIATAIQIAKKQFWEPLNKKERKNIAVFLDRSSRNNSWDNNHYLFHMTPLPLVEECGLQSYRKELEIKLERIINWYRGKGWFVDGCNTGFDWYNNHGFHLYLQLIYYFDEVWREKYGTIIREVTEDYLENLPLLFDDKGYAIPWGRSLAYRFVNVAPIGWMVTNKLWSLDLSLAKGISNRSLKLFIDNGALDKNGLLTPGYFKENKELKETYMDYGAQYFAVHGFSSLLLPESHPYWEKNEADIPSGTAILPFGVVKKTTTRGAILYNISNSLAGDRWQRSIKYYQHTYSTQNSLFCVGNGKDRYPNQTGISFDGKTWQYRKDPEALLIKKDYAISKWDIESANEYRASLITYHLFFSKGEVYIIYHTAATPLLLRFSGPAYCRDALTCTIIEKLWGPAGTFSQVDAGVDLYYRQPGLYPLWESKTKVLPYVPLVFAVKSDAKKDTNKGTTGVCCQRKERLFTIKWDLEEKSIELPVLKSRLNNLQLM